LHGADIADRPEPTIRRKRAKHALGHIVHVRQDVDVQTPDRRYLPHPYIPPPIVLLPE